MKLLILGMSLLVSVTAGAAAVTALDLDARKVGYGIKDATYVLNGDDTVSVKLTVTKHIGPRNTQVVKSFSAVVPELSVIGEELVLTSGTEKTVCGTIGETRILRRPVIYVNTSCTLDISTVKTETGKRVLVEILTNNPFPG